LIIESVQTPDGLVADTSPTYFVTFLTNDEDPRATFFSQVDSYRIEGAKDVEEVIDWATSNQPPNLLLAEISVFAYQCDTTRSRVWFNQPDSNWARDVGPDFTY